LLYHMLTGRPPHRTAAAEHELAACETTSERLAAYRRLIEREGVPTDHRQRPGVDKRLAEIVERCLAPLPAERFRNAQSVLDAFDARDRQRSRRPLVALGLIGPLLLLAAMSPFFLTTMRNAELTAKRNLVERALESGALSARLLARNLERELQKRTTDLERIARDAELRRLVEEAEASAWTNRAALEAKLAQLRAEEDAMRAALGQPADTSWFFQDAEGIQRWRDPFNRKTHDRNFNWRDYFHGRGIEYPPGAAPAEIGPIQSSYVSTVFRSDATGEYMVSITTPLFSHDGARIIGVLGRTQHLWELLADYEQGAGASDENGVERLIALIDGRDWKLVAHEWMTEEHVKGMSHEEAARLRLSPQQAERLARTLASPAVREGDAALLHDYRDPVAESGFDPEHYGGVWLAAVRPVAGTGETYETGWLAIVQERYDAAIAPAERMRSELLLYAVAALAVGGGLIVTFWYFVTQALRESSAMSRRRREIRDGEEAGRTS
jgi:hypothetical protein